jgi:hypothetical protein
MRNAWSNPSIEFSRYSQEKPKESVMLAAEIASYIETKIHEEGHAIQVPHHELSVDATITSSPFFLQVRLLYDR